MALQSLEIKLILYCCSDKVREMHDLKWHDLWFFSKVFLLFQKKGFRCFPGALLSGMVIPWEASLKKKKDKEGEKINSLVKSAGKCSALLLDSS